MIYRTKTSYRDIREVLAKRYSKLILNNSRGRAIYENKINDNFDKKILQRERNKIYRRCFFCNLESDKLNEKELNVHYWKYCPMLMRCMHCDQVIEIAALHQHLTGDIVRFHRLTFCLKSMHALLSTLANFKTNATRERCTKNVRFARKRSIYTS